MLQTMVGQRVRHDLVTEQQEQKDLVDGTADGDEQKEKCGVETMEKEDKRGTKMIQQKYRGGDKCKRVS